MPTFKVTDPTTGKTVRLTGDSAPTEQELNDIFANINGKQEQPKAQAQPNQEGGLINDIINAVKTRAGNITNPKPSYMRNVDPMVLGPALNVAGQTGGLIGDLTMAGLKAVTPAPIKEAAKMVLGSLKGNPIVDAAATAFNALPQESKTDWENLINTGNLAMVKPGVAAGKEGFNIARDIGTLVTTKAPAAIEKELSGVITKGVEKGIRPTVVGKRTAQKMGAYYEKAKDAVKTIIDNKSDLALTDLEGNVIQGELPKTLKQFSEAIDQTKRKIYSQYHSMATEAGEAGAVFNADGIIAKLDNVTKDLKYNPQVRKYAEDLKGEIGELHGQPPEIVEARIADLNNSLTGYYEGRVGKAKAQVDGSVAKHMREELDNIIMNSSGPGYQGLKNQYGSLKALEKEVNHRAVVDARKSPKGFFDLSDIFTKGEILTGILTANPALIARGGAGLGIKNLYKRLNNPDRIIQKMFSESENIIGKPTVLPEMRSATGQKILGQLSGLDDLMERQGVQTPYAVRPDISRRPGAGVPEPGNLEVGPVLSGRTVGEPYGPQPGRLIFPKELPEGQGFTLNGEPYGADIIDAIYKSKSTPIERLPGTGERPQIPWQDFQLKGEPYQEGVLVGEPYGPEILRPTKGNRPVPGEIIDAEYENIPRLVAPDQATQPLGLPAGQGFELVDQPALARPMAPKAELGTLAEAPQQDFIGSNMRAVRERQAALKEAKLRESENLVTYVQNLGGIKWTADYNPKILRQNPDLKRTLNNKTGQSPDAIAAQLQAEGWNISSGDELIELLKAGKGRTIYNPNKAEQLINRDIGRRENEWIKKQLTKEQIDTGAVRESLPDYQTRSIDEIGSEGILEERFADKALEEVSDFFSEMAGKARQTFKDIKQTATEKLKDERGSFSLKQTTPQAEAGIEWDQKEPIKTVGYRYGEAPSGGKSYNTRDSKYENGISLASAGGLNESRSFATESSKKRGKYYYEGEVIGYGGDDEPIMGNFKRITEKEYKQKLNDNKDASLRLAHDKLYTAQFLKSRGYKGFDEDIIKYQKIINDLRISLPNPSPPNKKILGTLK